VRLIVDSLLQPVVDHVAGTVQTAAMRAILAAQVRAAVEGAGRAGSGGRQRRARRAQRLVRRLGCSRPAYVGMSSAAAQFEEAARRRGWPQSEDASESEDVDYFSAEEDAV
jgi:hypothetical protein